MKDKYLKIDKVSESFCAAKWLQVTVYLQNGVNHSCHHPNTHRIPLDLVSKDVGVFHNTPFKATQRKMMLDGKRPPECSYCWNIEDSVGKYSSDRFIKSTDPWAFKHIDKISKLDASSSLSPSYLEVSLGNECNFACSYCKADSSSRIHNELKQFGNYPTNADYGKLEWLEEDNRLPLYAVEENPYFPLFMSWLENIIHDLEVFRVTGGEPLINSQFPKILELLRKKSNKNLVFSINSNLGIKTELVEKYAKEITQLQSENLIANDFTIYTSLESFGEQAEYIRFGLNMKLFEKNVYHILETTNFQIVFMVTFNILSIPKFSEFLEYILKLKKSYSATRVILDTSYLNSPNYMSVKYINNSLLESIGASLEIMAKNQSEIGFSKYEIDKFKRIYLWLISLQKNKTSDDDELRAKCDFVKFFDEYDKRKGLNFLKTFPELKKYYYECKLLLKDLTYTAKKNTREF